MDLFKQFLLDYIADYAYDLKFDQFNILLELSNESKVLLNDEDVLRQLFIYQNNLIKFKTVETDKKNKGIVLEQFPKEGFIQFQKETVQKEAIQDTIELLNLAKTWSLLKDDYLANQSESHLLKIITNNSYFSQHLLMSLLRQKDIKEDVLDFFKQENVISYIEIAGETKIFMENKIPLLTWLFSNELFSISNELLNLSSDFSIETEDELGNTMAFFMSNKKHLDFLNKYKPNWFHVNNFGEECLNYLVENKRLKNKFGVDVDLSSSEKVGNTVLDEALNFYRLRASFVNNNYKNFCDIFKSFKNTDNVINNKIKGYHWLYAMDFSEMGHEDDYVDKISFLCQQGLDLSQKNDIDNTMLASYVIKNIKQLKCNNSTDFIFNALNHQNNCFNTLDDYHYFIRDIFISNSLEIISSLDKYVDLDDSLKKLNKTSFNFSYKSYPPKEMFYNFYGFSYPTQALKEVYSDVLFYANIYIKDFVQNQINNNQKSNKSIGEYIFKTALMTKNEYDDAFTAPEKSVSGQLLQKMVDLKDVESIKWIFLETCLTIKIVDEWFEEFNVKDNMSDNSMDDLLLNLSNINLNTSLEVFKKESNLDWIVFSNFNYLIPEKEVFESLPQVIKFTEKRIGKTNNEEKNLINTLNKTKKWLEYHSLKSIDQNKQKALQNRPAIPKKML